jgi:probable F420-dependent oxidoreductase
MKVGVTIPNHWGVGDIRSVVELGELAETLKFDSVWTMDHLLHVGRVQERLEGRPYWHPLAVLTAVAGRTSKVMLGTSVMVLPYHDPVGLAKYAATLDALSEGRLILGVGVGALREEFAALGVPATRRGAITDESIAVIKDLWTNPEPSYTGGRFAFRNLGFSPNYVDQRHPPLWIGGGSPAAIRRTARVGDGWHPTNITSAEYAQGASDLRDQALELGRNPDLIERSIRFDVVTDGGPSPARVAELEARMSLFADAGVEHAVLALTGDNTQVLRDWMVAISERFACTKS